MADPRCPRRPRPRHRPRLPHPPRSPHHQPRPDDPVRHDPKGARPIGYIIAPTVPCAWWRHHQTGEPATATGIIYPAGEPATTGKPACTGCVAILAGQDDHDFILAPLCPDQTAHLHDPAHAIEYDPPRPDPAIH